MEHIGYVKIKSISIYINILIIIEFNRLRREYTGEWINDKKEGKGAFFYQGGDRYDG